MEHYIDKESLAALIKSYKDSFCDRNGYLEDSETNGLAYDTLCDLEDSIDSLEVKEVDLEKEIQQHIKDCLDIKFPTTNIKMIEKDVEFTARRFFKLGLRAQKEE